MQRQRAKPGAQHVCVTNHDDKGAANYQSEHNVSSVEGVRLQFVPEIRVLHVRAQVKS